MSVTVKDTVIELLKISECNLLMSMKGLRPSDVHVQALPQFNPISWIFGHCAVHLHWVIGVMERSDRVFSKEVVHYYRYGTTKEEILGADPPITFPELVDGFLDVSKGGYAYLDGLDEDTLCGPFVEVPSESIIQTIKRVAFHYVGHSGQILLIRSALGNPGPFFVSGITVEERKKLMDEWISWWESSKTQFVD
ncbi:MAG: hypothetical protein JSW61_07370 [Candidatus Thorarchaeota archaeon]|nr:MAG: hypothetical protein JSW61_07370 [Candidatus Thorarchaeota archaeon]